MMLCRQWVTRQLKKWSDIRFPADGLPPEVALMVNGRSWSTDAAFEMVRPALFQQDIERAMLEVVIRAALRQELDKQQASLTDEEFRKDFEEYRKDYDNTPFTTEVIAVHFKGYPSLEAYRQRWRLIRAFEKMIAKDINDENLQAHADKYKRFFSDGTANVDTIQFFAKDAKSGAWVPNGFEGARKRATEAYEAIQGGASFDDIHGQRGEYFSTDNEKGRLGAKSLNQIRQSLRENEFSDLLLGYSIGTDAFYDAPIGKVIGPLRGTEGYYLIRVNARTPAHTAVVVTDARTRELVKQDYVSHRFLAWANDVVAKATIR
jgi:hypothetical protein